VSPGKHTCEVLLVGGGVVGMSVALELAAAGTDVLLVDRGALGGASTSLNAGGVRQQFYQDTNILAARATVERLTLMTQDGMDFGYRQVGYLLLYGTAEQEARLLTGVLRQNALGVPTRMIDLDEAREIAPDVDMTDMSGACFGPTDGYLQPRLLASALRQLVLDSPVRVLEGAEVRATRQSAARVTEVVTSVGDISAGTVVNCAGAWAPAIARMMGEYLPIVPRRSQIFVMEDVPPLSDTLPHTFDCTSRFYVRRHGNEVWSGAAFKPVLPQAPGTPGLDADWSEAAELAHRVGQRLPALAGRSFDRAWAGVIEVTADDNPIVGWTAPDNVYTAAGFSGHGMCIGLGLASSISAEIRREQPDIPLDIYRGDRFNTGVPEKSEGLWLGPRPSQLDDWLGGSRSMSSTASEVDG